MSPTIEKILPYIKYVVLGAIIIVLSILFIYKSKQYSDLDKAMQLYQRQVTGQLTDKEKQLQAANDALGISQSKFMAQADLAKAYQQENIKTTAAFEKFKADNKIQLESYQRTIAALNQKIQNGTTTVIVGVPRPTTDPKPDNQFNKPIDPTTTKLAYKWDSGDGRFSLDDPDIFTSNNETFKLHQSFRVTGEIYSQKDGFLKTDRLVLEEVVQDGVGKDNTPNYKTVNTASIVDSKFNYTAPKPNAWIPRKSVFGIWGVITANFALNNGLNPRFLLGTGLEFLQAKGVGIGLQTYLDATKWQDSAFGVSFSYRPTIKNTQLNVGVNLGLATQFRAPFQSYVPNAGIVFYLW